MRNLLGDKDAVNLGGHAGFVRCFVQDEDLSGKDVLDVGCGFAWFCELALTRGARSVVGIEPEEASLDVARRSVLDQRCSFRVASATHLPFADESFDVVSLWEVLEHLPKSARK